MNELNQNVPTRRNHGLELVQTDVVRVQNTNGYLDSSAKYERCLHQQNFFCTFFSEPSFLSKRNGCAEGRTIMVLLGARKTPVKLGIGQKA